MNDVLKILILEDVNDDVGLVQYTLKKTGLQFDLHQVDTREEFTQSLHDYQPDVILSDHSLPAFNSIEAMKICKQLKLPVPFILVTGSVSEEFAVTCLKEGADDYVLKSNLTRLPLAIDNALRQRKYLADQKKSEITLRNQYAALVKINQEMDSFIYSVSHNIRAPLASVMGLLSLVSDEDKKRDSYFVEYFNMMARSVDKLDETIKEILEYSQNARSELKVEEINIREVVSASLDRMQYIEGFNDVKQSVSITQTESFYSDRYRLMIIFSNLISNSIRYRDTNKNECALTINVTVQEGVAEFAVEDNGIGIESEFLPRIWDMFFRATIKSDGAGLGLYIARETVHKLGGEISITSTANQGTRCVMKFPVVLTGKMNTPTD